MATHRCRSAAAGAILFGITLGTLEAQIPRGRPIPAFPPTIDPAGTFADEVDGLVTGFDGTNRYLLGLWNFTVRARPCPDCDRGQYVLSLDYRGMTYQNPDGTLIQERGFGGGVLNPSANVIDFNLFASNCREINPGNQTAPLPPGFGFVFKGSYDAGGLGPAPGTALTIKGNASASAISGRISGFDCYGQVVNADVFLRKR